MSENSNIQWTDHTFNGWWGCTKVHAGCKNCYAEALDKRFGPSHWGNNPRRMVLGEWSKPEKWNMEAWRAGKRARVFCSSMCDVFEDYRGPVVDQQGNDVKWSVDGLRRRIFTMIEQTPWLEWLLLTKRPENIRPMVPLRWLDNWPANVMTGTSPCDQKTANECIPHLLAVPGRHFLSCEPLLGPIDFTDDDGPNGMGGKFSVLNLGIDWVIIGGESGHGARPCDVRWIESIAKQCADAGVAYFVKQLGAHAGYSNPIGDAVRAWGDCTITPYEDGVRFITKDKKGGDPSEWPSHLRVRQFPGGAAC
jgi:protein gp37